MLQESLSIACDEGVYHIAREVLLIRPHEFNDIVITMGSFHMTKVYLSCIGKYLVASGAEEIWLENGIFGVNVTSSVLKGTNYARSVRVTLG